MTDAEHAAAIREAAANAAKHAEKMVDAIIAAEKVGLIVSARRAREAYSAAAECRDYITITRPVRL